MAFSSEIRSIHPWAKVYLGLIAFSMAGSTASKFAHLDPGPIKPFAAWATLLAGAYVVSRPFPWKWVVAIGIGGLLAELCGVMTGFPFGQYKYTDQWWPAVPLGSHGYLPLALPFAWILTTCAARGWLRSKRNAWVNTGILATLADAVMEPTMTQRLKYWTWLPTQPDLQHTVRDLPPFTNSVAWFALSAFAGSLLMPTERLKDEEMLTSRVVLSAHVLFSLYLLILG